MAGILFIISAPSGSGKSTLVAQLRTLVEGLEFSISYTTRAPRGSETDGREYHFTQRDTFEQMAVFLTWRLHDSLPPHRPFPTDTLNSGQAFAAMDRLLDEASMVRSTRSEERRVGK